MASAADRAGALQRGFVCAQRNGIQQTLRLLDPRLRNTLQRAAARRSSETRCSTLHRGAAFRNTLQHAAARRSAAQLRNTLQRAAAPKHAAARRSAPQLRNTPQRAAARRSSETRRSAPQRGAALRNTPRAQVHRLPQCIAERQQQALERRYHGDTTCIEACSKLHLCIHCVARKGTVQGIRLCHDCQSGELVCKHCGPGTVLTIHMVGCIATVAKDRLLLSSCCGCFVYYAGTGTEYACKCGPQCALQRQLFSKRERTTAASRPLQQRACFVCAQRNGIQQTLRLLDPRQRCIVPYGLCCKHVVPHHISSKIFDKEALLLYFRQHAITAGKRPASSASLPQKSLKKRRDE